MGDICKWGDFPLPGLISRGSTLDDREERFLCNVSKGRLGNLQNQNKTRSLKQVNSGKNNGRKKHGGNMCWPMSKYSNFTESMEGSCLQVRVRGAVDQWEHDYDLGQAS